MSMTTSMPSGPQIAGLPPVMPLRFGVAHGGDVEWLLKRNCSISPQRLLQVYGLLCAVSLGVATLCWSLGATLVMPFAWLEMGALGLALWVHGRHVGDRERIAWRQGCVTVETTDGSSAQRVEFGPGGVRVATVGGGEALIELSSRGLHVSVGRHTRPELRPLLAKELRDVLGSRPAAAWGETD